MQSQVDQLSPVEVLVKVEVPWSKVNEGLEGAYKAVQRTARVRGFRQGKVPRNVVKNLMGKSIEREVAARLVDESLSSAVNTHAIQAVLVSSLDSSFELTHGEPLRFSAKIEVRPKIEQVHTGGLRVERKVAKVTDEQVEAELAGRREQGAELAAPSPARPAKHGDVLTLSLAVSVDGTPRPDMANEETRIELVPDRLLPELEQGLQGIAVGETREISLTFPDDYGREELRGKPAVFSVSVKEMKEQVLPELDDELARDFGHGSLAELRAALRAALEADALRRADADVREALVDMVLDKNPVPVPPTLVERQEQAMLQELHQFQQMLGRPLPVDESMHAELHQRAERRVRAGLLFGAIAVREKIEATSADVDKRLEEIAAQSGKHVAKVRAEYQGERRDALQGQILQNKLLEYLVAQATIADVEATAAEPSAPSSAPAQEAP